MNRHKAVPILASILLVIFLAGVAFEIAVASPADWPMYRNDLLHTGVAADTLPPPLSLKWKQTFAGAVVSSPAIVGSRVYVGVNDPTFNFYAIDATTGNIIWSFNDGGAALAWWSSPAVATVSGNTVIFVGNANGNLYAIRDDGTTPFKLWAKSLGGGAALSSPAVTTIAATQVVIAAGSAGGIGGLWAVVAATGAPYPGWTTNPFTDLGAATVFTSSPAILGSTIFIGNNNKKLYAVNLGNGVKLWDTAAIVPAIGGAVISSPAVATVSGQDWVFFGADDFKMYALVAATGTLKWSQPVGGLIHSSPAIATIPNPPAACTPGPTLAVIFGSDDHNLYAMRATDGTPCWTFPSTGAAFFRSSPTVSGQTVYVGSNDHNIYAIDINTGTWQWSFPATAEVGDLAGFGCPNPVISGSTLYFGSNAPDDRLYAFQSAIPVVTTTATSIIMSSTTTTVPVTQTSTVATTTVTTGITQTQTTMTATTQTQTATSTSITTTQTQTATVTSTTSTTTTVPSQGIPGFPVESILVGLAGGLVVLTLLGRRRRRQ